jgi:endonuclease/exonuclease/phosphatase family metal-dependent hydrolase
VRTSTVSFIAAAAVAVLACGGSSSSQPTTPTATPAAIAIGGGQLRVATFNIQHGLNNDGAYDLQWAIRTIAALNPDIVGVQELTRNHPAYKCEDQPVKIAQGLSQATGRTWSYIYKAEWTTTVNDCKGDTPETEGNGFFAPVPISEAGSVSMWNGRNGLKTMVGSVAIVTTHLQSGKLPENSSDRMRQLGTLLPWTAQQGTPRILVCDCNANPESPEYGQLHAMYHDAWSDALAAGRAKGRMDGITHKSSRIDYVFFDPGAALSLVSMENVETPSLVGLEASDHRPQLAVFSVR